LPDISFLDLKQFNHFRFLAGYVLCGRDVKPGENAIACSGQGRELKVLRGKVVLIGELNRDEDEHSTVMGRIPGLYLQANFIEALLDDRYYQGMPDLNYALGFAFLVCLEAILVFLGSSWVKKAAAIAILVLGILSLLYIIISDLHWYVNPLPIFTLVLLLRALAPNPTPHREVLGNRRIR
jgi:CHASE2 domain-containing sensor protein